MQSHEIDYTIIGAEMQLVEITLDPGETVVAEAGAMTYMEKDITFDTRLRSRPRHHGKTFFGRQARVHR